MEKHVTLAWRSSEDKIDRSAERAGCQTHLWESLAGGCI